MKIIKKLFPSFGVKNILIYYLQAIFFNGWFILPNWVFYFSKYISIKEIGVVEGVAVLVGVLMEVPSGVLSDLLGKKKTIIFGSLMLLLSCIILINATAFIHFLIGNVVMFIGFSFHSGATEAFAYDSLIESKQENKYDTVVSRYTSISIITTVATTFLGGYFYSLSPRGPFYAWIVFILISIAIMIPTIEPAIDSIKFNVKNYLNHLREGVLVLFSGKLKSYLVLIMFLAVLIKLYQGIVRQSLAGYFSYTGETFGYLFALITIPATIISFKFDRILNFFKEKKLLLLILITYLISFSIAVFSRSLLAGGFVFLLLTTSENITRPLVSVIINNRIDSRHRATTISTLALLSQIPYIVLVLGFANMVEVSLLPKLLTLYLVSIIIVLFYSIIKFRASLVTQQSLQK